MEYQVLITISVVVLVQNCFLVNGGDPPKFVGTETVNNLDNIGFENVRVHHIPAVDRSTLKEKIVGRQRAMSAAHKR